jgi:thioesterase domain-containing protein
MESDYPLTSVESMADAYVRSLNSRYSHGIVHLGGWSMGGLIAFEMARVLRRQGRQVGVLAMIDTWMRREHLAEQRSADHLRILDFRRWRIHYKLVTGSIGVLEDNSHPFWQLDESGRLEFLARAGSAARPERYVNPGGNERFQSESEAYMLLRCASDAYKPQAQTTDITFITADAERDVESIAVWRELVSGPVHVLVCPGNHLSIVDDPNAETLAHLLSSTMTTAESVHPGPDVRED